MLRSEPEPDCLRSSRTSPSCSAGSSESAGQLGPRRRPRKGFADPPKIQRVQALQIAFLTGLLEVISIIFEQSVLRM